MPVDSGLDPRWVLLLLTDRCVLPDRVPQIASTRAGHQSGSKTGPTTTESVARVNRGSCEYALRRGSKLAIWDMDLLRRMAGGIGRPYGGFTKRARCWEPFLIREQNPNRYRRCGLALPQGLVSLCPCGHFRTAERTGEDRTTTSLLRTRNRRSCFASVYNL